MHTEHMLPAEEGLISLDDLLHIQLRHDTSQHVPIAVDEQPCIVHATTQALPARSTRYLVASPPQAADSAVCARCGGAGWYTLPVALGHPDFAKLQPCACRQTERSTRQAAELERLSNLATFRDKTFAAFDGCVSGVLPAFQIAQAFVLAPHGWLALFGPYGCGKTHLAAAIANAVLDHGMPVLFVVVPDLLDHLRSTFASDSTVSYDQRFETVKQAPLLILDDLGTESATPWAKEKLYQLVNFRYNERLPTVFTSNVRMEQLDGRIASRMHDSALNAAVLTIQAADYRKRKRREP